MYIRTDRCTHYFEEKSLQCPNDSICRYSDVPGLEPDPWGHAIFLCLDCKNEALGRVKAAQEFRLEKAAYTNSNLWG